MKIEEILEKELSRLHSNAIKKGSRFSGTRLVSMKALCDEVSAESNFITTHPKWRQRVEVLFEEVEKVIQTTGVGDYPLYKQSYTDVGLNLFENYQIGIGFYEDISNPVDVSYRTPARERKNLKFAINPIYQSLFDRIKQFADSEWEFTLDTIRETINRELKSLQNKDVDLKHKDTTSVQENLDSSNEQTEEKDSKHLEMQYKLIKLGLSCNCQVFVANSRAEA